MICSQWEFLISFGLLVLFFHWSVCALMILTDIENAEPNWRTAVGLSQNPDVADDDAPAAAAYTADTIARLLKQGRYEYDPDTLFNRNYHHSYHHSGPHSDQFSGQSRPFSRRIHSTLQQ